MPAINFNVADVPEPSYDPLPAGDYLVWITESEMPTDEQGNSRIEITMDVLEPQQYQGRKAWDSFTVEHHTQPKWAETGRTIFAGVCRAVGVMSPRTTEELHEIPFWVRLEVESWKDGSLHNKVVARWSTSSQAPPHKKPKGAAPAAPQAPRPGHQTGYMPQAPQYAPPPQQRPQQAPAQPSFLHQPPPHYQAPQSHQTPPPGAPMQTQPPMAQPAHQYAPPQPQQYQPPGPPAWAQPQQPPQQGYQPSPSDEGPF